MAQNFWKINNGITFTAQASPPGSPVDGDMYYDTTLSCVRGYQNGQWINLDGTFIIKNDASTTGANATATPLKEQFLRLTNASLTSLAGIASQTSAKFLVLLNVTGSSIQINNEDGLASASNRIITGTGSSIPLENNTALTLIYDTTSSRWRIAGGAGNNTGYARIFMNS